MSKDHSTDPPVNAGQPGHKQQDHEDLNEEASSIRKEAEHVVQSELRENAAVRDIGALAIKQTLPQATGQRRSDRGGRKK